MRGIRKLLSRRAGMVAIVIAAVVLYALGFVGGEPGIESGSALTPALSARLGFYPGYAALAQLRSLETLVGHPASYVVQFGDTHESAFTSSIWGEVTRAGSLQTISKQVTLVESIPLGFGDAIDATTAAGRETARANLQATADGAHDAVYRVAANYLRDGGYPDAIIRLGWEFDGSWYPWAARGNEALWISAYRHVADVFRSVSSSFRFDWNGTAGAIQHGAASAYPGDGYVDIIGLDVYDKALPVPWNPTTRSWEDPVAAFQYELADLRYQEAFAVAHGKSVSYPEWALTGVSATAKSAVGGDNPDFIQGMANWMNGLPQTGAGSLAYQSYFNEDTSDGHHRIDAGYFPNAEARYRALFGATTTLALSTTGAPSWLSGTVSSWGRAVTLKAKVSAPGLATWQLGGGVIFLDGVRVLGGNGLKNGIASLTVKAFGVGDHMVHAVYVPGRDGASATATRSHLVLRASTQVRLGGPSGAVASGAKVTVTARVASQIAGTGTPNGFVLFTNPTTHAQIRSALRGGVAAVVLSGLRAGRETVTAKYLGTTKYRPATAKSTVTVHPPGT